LQFSLTAQLKGILAGARSISSQVDNTLVESLDLNKNSLQYHTSESIKNLALKN